MPTTTQMPEHIKKNYAALKLQMAVLDVMIRDNAPIYFITEAIERVFEKVEDLRYDKKIDHPEEKIKLCCLCNKELDDPYGHHPAPLAKSGMCCSTCNQTKVLPARFVVGK